MGESLKSWMDRLFPWRAAERAAQRERDARLNALIENSYRNIRVVGRGTIQIDPEEVVNSWQFQQAREQAREIVASSAR
ncbi:MAG: hypothetical protein Q4B17_05955 [Lautropia sp.]|nr:hypothetical protein [Lautropia sp.]